MKVVFAIDSMKGSLTSLECGEAAAKGLMRAIPDAEYEVRPLADGGEGTVEAVTVGCGGTFEEISVTGPLGKKVKAKYGIIENPNKTAIIEMSAAAGLTLVSPVEMDPFKTTTYGVGEMIIDAINKGCRHFIIGLGGSATNDAGIGMLQALGAIFYDSRGAILKGENGYLYYYILTIFFCIKFGFSSNIFISSIFTIFKFNFRRFVIIICIICINTLSSFS